MYIQEAIKNIAEKKLDEMKQNIHSALSEKAIVKMEEKKIEMAKEYFAKDKSEKKD
jgi:regulator of replication initiation timing